MSREGSSIGKSTYNGQSHLKGPSKAFWIVGGRHRDTASRGHIGLKRYHTKGRIRR